MKMTFGRRRGGGGGGGGEVRERTVSCPAVGSALQHNSSFRQNITQLLFFQTNHNTTTLLSKQNTSPLLSDKTQLLFFQTKHNTTPFFQTQHNSSSFQTKHKRFSFRQNHRHSQPTVHTQGGSAAWCACTHACLLFEAASAVAWSPLLYHSNPLSYNVTAFEEESL